MTDRNERGFLKYGHEQEERAEEIGASLKGYKAHLIATAGKPVPYKHSWLTRLRRRINRAMFGFDIDDFS